MPIIWTAFELASLAHANERRVSEGWRPLIHDHQHPHDLFMELVGYDAPLSGQQSSGGMIMVQTAFDPSKLSCSPQVDPRTHREVLALDVGRGDVLRIRRPADHRACRCVALTG